MIVIPEGFIAPSNQLVAQLLLGKVERGRRVMQAVAVVLAIAALACVFANQIYVAIGLAVGGVLLGLAYAGLDRKFRIGREILEDPARATHVIQKSVLIGNKPMSFIRIQITNGGAYEVGLEPHEIIGVAKWLRERNPSVTLE